MSLTATQRKRLAREARKLAMECAEGTAPKFVMDSFCGCAIGEILARVGRRPVDLPPDHNWKLANEIDGLLPEEDGLGPLALGVVSNALIDKPDTVTQHAALVFPLLALADQLDPTP